MTLPTKNIGLTGILQNILRIMKESFGSLEGSRRELSKNPAGTQEVSAEFFLSSTKDFSRGLDMEDGRTSYYDFSQGNIGILVIIPANYSLYK